MSSLIVIWLLNKYGRCTVYGCPQREHLQYQPDKKEVWRFVSGDPRVQHVIHPEVEAPHAELPSSESRGMDAATKSHVRLLFDAGTTLN